MKRDSVPFVLTVLGRIGAIAAIAGVLNAASIPAPVLAAGSTHSLTQPAVGAAAPRFVIPNAQTGNAVSLQSMLAGKKAAVVIFVSTQCPVSQAYQTRMAELASKYGPSGVSFAGVDSNVTEPKSEVAAFFSSAHLGFPVLKDPNDVVADEYGATHTPEAYVIDSTGRLRYHGRIDDNMDESSADSHDLATALDAVLAGKPVPRAETKAFGCSIKRANS